MRAEQTLLDLLPMRRFHVIERLADPATEVQVEQMIDRLLLAGTIVNRGGILHRADHP